MTPDFIKNYVTQSVAKLMVEVENEIAERGVPLLEHQLNVVIAGMVAAMESGIATGFASEAYSKLTNEQRTEINQWITNISK